MNRKRRLYLLRIGKFIFFIIGFLIIFIVATDIVKPKWLFFTNQSSPETEIWNTFYKEPKDSIDVLFVGTSHVYDGINPAIFYELTQMTSFDIASSDQDMPTSYYYIKEALQYQKPKYIVLDTYGFLSDAYSDSVCYKRSLDDMRWSKVKLEAIQNWLPHVEGETLFVRIFTIMDYHSRWEELTELDFTYKSQISSVNGFVPYFDAQEIVHDHSYYEIVEDKELNSETLEYFAKIKALCDENNIELVLSCAPTKNWKKTYSQKIKQLAEEYSVKFYEFNEDKKYNQMKLDGKTDFRNEDHLNVYGAKKFTNLLAKELLKDEFTPQTHTEEVTKLWNEKVDNWNALYQSNTQKD